METDLTYRVERSRRKTVALKICPDGTLLVLAPTQYPTKDIESLVRNVATNLLVINFKDQSTLKVVIDSNKFDDFASTLMKEEKGISYGETDETDKK